MLKKIFSTVIILAAVLIGSVTSAAETLEVKNVAVLLEPPIESFDKAEKVHDSIEQTVTKIFKNASNYNVMSIDETAGYIQIYREENALGAETFFKKSDIDTICKNIGSDFIVYLRIDGNEPKTLSESILGAPAKVVLDFRIWSNAKKDFIYFKRVTKNDDYSFEKSLNKCLQEIEKDAAKVRAVM